MKPIASIAPTGDVRVFFETVGCKIFVYRRLLCLVFRSELDAAMIRKSFEAGARLEEETQGQGFGSFAFYDASLSLPSAEVREAIQEAVRGADEHHVLARAVLLPRQGFWASALQAVCTATTSVGKRRVPTRFCVDEKEAVAFFQEQHVPGLDPTSAGALLRAREAVLVG